MILLRQWQSLLATVLALLAALFIPFHAEATAASVAVVTMLVIAASLSAPAHPSRVQATILAILTHGAAALLLLMLPQMQGNAGAGYFAALAASWLLGWRLVSVLAADGRNTPKWAELLIPVLFGLWILILWECIVRGFGIPFVLLPAPSAIGEPSI